MDPVAATQLWLVRHGRTEWARSGRHTGRTDVPLDDVGRAQAAALHATFEGLAPSQVFTSPLQRAHDTCRLAGYGDVAVVEPCLMEWDYGDFEGLTRAEIHGRWPNWSVWADGAPGGESPTDVAARVDDFLTPHLHSGETLVLFAHGHLLRMLASRWLGLGTTGGRLFVLNPASLCLLGYDRGQPVVKSWNAQRLG